MSELKRGSIIQANEKAGEWFGSVLIVDKVTAWGVQSLMHIPREGDAYIRLKHDQYEDLNALAVFMPEE